MIIQLVISVLYGFLLLCNLFTGDYLNFFIDFIIFSFNFLQLYNYFSIPAYKLSKDEYIEDVINKYKKVFTDDKYDLYNIEIILPFTPKKFSKVITYVHRKDIFKSVNEIKDKHKKRLKYWYKFKYISY